MYCTIHRAIHDDTLFIQRYQWFADTLTTTAKCGTTNLVDTVVNLLYSGYAQSNVREGNCDERIQRHIQTGIERV